MGTESDPWFGYAQASSCLCRLSYVEFPETREKPTAFVWDFRVVRPSNTFVIARILIGTEVVSQEAVILG